MLMCMQTHSLCMCVSLHVPKYFLYLEVAHVPHLHLGIQVIQALFILKELRTLKGAL